MRVCAHCKGPLPWELASSGWTCCSLRCERNHAFTTAVDEYEDREELERDEASAESLNHIWEMPVYGGPR